MKFKAIVNASQGDQLSFIPKDEKGNPTPLLDAYQFDAESASLYSNYFEIVQDFEDATMVLSEALKFDSEKFETVRKALITEGIISYARPFTKSNGRKVKLLKETEWADETSEGFRRHVELMTFRDKVIAHTDSSPFRGIQTSMVVDSIERPTAVYGVYYLKVNWAGMHDEDIHPTIEHINSLITRIKEKMKLFAQNLHKAAESAITNAMK